jgi:hypothetical protein
MDVSEPFEWKVKPLEGAEDIDDMVVQVQRIQAPATKSATEFEFDEYRRIMGIIRNLFDSCMFSVSVGRGTALQKITKRGEYHERTRAKNITRN